MDTYTPITQYVVTREVMLQNDVMAKSSYQQREKKNCLYLDNMQTNEH